MSVGELLSPFWEWLHRDLFRLAGTSLSVIEILKAALCLLLFHLLAVRLRRLIETSLTARQLLELHTARFLGRVVFLVCWFAGLLAAVDVLELNLSGLKFFAGAFGGAFGVGIAFGSQTIANNLISGLILMLDRSVRVGDVISIGDQLGTVVSIGARATVIRTLQNHYITIPNVQLISTSLTNWTASQQPVRVDVAVSVGAVDAVEEVEALLLEVARSHPKVLNEPSPKVLLTRLGADVLGFEVQVFLSEPFSTREVQSDLNRAFYRALREKGYALR